MQGNELTIRVRPGRHSIRVKNADGESIPYEVTIEPASQKTHEFTFAPPVVAGPREAPRANPSYAGPVVLGLIGVAALGTGTVTGIMARGKTDDIEARCPNDICPVDYDFSPTTLDRFRAHLKRKYKTIVRFNRSWGTRCAGFEQVVPRTYQEALEHRTNLAPWMEHRKFMDATFRRWLTDRGTHIRRIDPQAKVGITGLPGGGIGSFLGIDNFHHARTLDYTILYSSRRFSELL